MLPFSTGLPTIPPDDLIRKKRGLFQTGSFISRTVVRTSSADESDSGTYNCTAVYTGDILQRGPPLQLIANGVANTRSLLLIVQGKTVVYIVQTLSGGVLILFP